jgi:ABC-type proline/glycine betaine transport system ATPase subunit
VLGNRIGVLDDGALVVCDTPDVVARSADSRVRRFLDAIPAVPRPH